MEPNHNDSDLTQLVEDIIAASSILESSLLALDNYNVETEDLLLTTLVERNIYTVASLSPIVLTLGENMQAEFGFGLIIRTFYLDLLFTIRLNDIYANLKCNADALGKYVFDLLSDGLRFAILSLTEDYKKGFITENDWVLIKNYVRVRYADFLVDPADDQIAVAEPFDKKITRASHVFKEIIKNSENELYVKTIYSKYSWYSKYEHINVLNYDMVRSSTESMMNRVKYGLVQIITQAYLLQYMLNFRVGKIADLNGKLEAIKNIADKYK